MLVNLNKFKLKKGPFQFKDLSYLSKAFRMFRAHSNNKIAKFILSEKGKVTPIFPATFFTGKEHTEEAAWRSARIHSCSWP